MAKKKSYRIELDYKADVLQIYEYGELDDR